MKHNPPDRRTAPYRADLASASLRNLVDAPRYVEPWAMEIVTDVVPVRVEPSSDAIQVTQALYGEQVSVYEERDGWSWVQIGTDDYIGYICGASLGPPAPKKTHKICTLRSYLFSRADLKSPPRGLLSLGSRFSVRAESNGFFETANGGFVFCRHAVPLENTEPDYVAVAERFIGTPYFWGGRSSLGLDCSALVQLALATTGVQAPRDSDMQMDMGIELPLSDIGAGKLMRGDLVFWRGHLGVMADDTTLLHANAHHMAVAIEPLTEAIARIAASGLDVIGVRRL